MTVNSNHWRVSLPGSAHGTKSRKATTTLTYLDGPMPYPCRVAACNNAARYEWSPLNGPRACSGHHFMQQEPQAHHVRRAMDRHPTWSPNE